jgi:quercetin dioxygenase-like cupin family protein
MTTPKNRVGAPPLICLKRPAKVAIGFNRGNPSMKTITLILAATLATVTVASAQAPPATRTIFDRADATANQEAVFGSAKFPEGGVAARHTHPGVEMGVILEGEVEIRIDGQPTRILKAGEHFTVPRDVPHSAHSLAPGGAAMSNLWLVDKGVPMATPVN